MTSLSLSHSVKNAHICLSFSVKMLLFTRCLFFWNKVCLSFLPLYRISFQHFCFSLGTFLFLNELYISLLFNSYKIEGSPCVTFAWFFNLFIAHLSLLHPSFHQFADFSVSRVVTFLTCFHFPISVIFILCGKTSILLPETLKYNFCPINLNQILLTFTNSMHGLFSLFLHNVFPFLLFGLLKIYLLKSMPTEIWFVYTDFCRYFSTIITA